MEYNQQAMDRIERYLTNTMPPPERAAFEERMEVDQNLRELVGLQRKMMDSKTMEI